MQSTTRVSGGTHHSDESLVPLMHLMALFAYLTSAFGPTQSPSVPASGGLAPWQERRAKEIMSNNLGGTISTLRLANECKLSRSYFARAFKKTTGTSPHRWLRARRIDAAKELLLTSELPLAEIALVCGFADQSHFTRVFTGLAGMGPGAWRRAKRQ
jgi:AraC family transcriptional regulator